MSDPGTGPHMPISEAARTLRIGLSTVQRRIDAYLAQRGDPDYWIVGGRAGVRSKRYANRRYVEALARRLAGEAVDLAALRDRLARETGPDQTGSDG